MHSGAISLAAGGVHGISSYCSTAAGSPPFIALCGFPGAGKTEVQRMLSRIYNVMPIDDGAALRDFAQRHLGLSWEDTHTASGKKRKSTILGKEWENRDILGSIGKALETTFGEHITPWMAVESITGLEGIYSFGSVRKTQGWFFRERGGIVVEVAREGCSANYDFDKYDRNACHFTIDNSGDLKELERRVRFLFDNILCVRALPSGETDGFDVV